MDSGKVMTGRARGSTPNSLLPIPSAPDLAVKWLLDNQTSDGYWSAEFEGDTILESEYIILMRFLGRGDEAKLRKAAAYLRSKQMDNGGWPCYPGGPVDASASVEAYFAASSRPPR